MSDSQVQVVYVCQKDCSFGGRTWRRGDQNILGPNDTIEEGSAMDKYFMSSYQIEAATAVGSQYEIDLKALESTFIAQAKGLRTRHTGEAARLEEQVASRIRQEMVGVILEMTERHRREMHELDQQKIKAAQNLKEEHDKRVEEAQEEEQRKRESESDDETESDESIPPQEEAEDGSESGSGDSEPPETADEEDEGSAGDGLGELEKSEEGSSGEGELF